MLEAYSCNMMAVTFPHFSQPDISEAYSGNIMALSFPKVARFIWQSGTLDAFSGNIMAVCFP